VRATQLYAEKHRDRPELIILFCEIVSIDFKEIVGKQKLTK